MGGSVIISNLTVALLSLAQNRVAQLRILRLAKRLGKPTSTDASLDITDAALDITDAALDITDAALDIAEGYTASPPPKR